MDNISDILDKEFYSAHTSGIYAKTIDNIERILIAKALERSYGNQVAAARLLGLHRNTLRNKIKKFNIDARGFKK